MRYKVIRTNHHADARQPSRRRRDRRVPTEPEWSDANLWVEHDTIPDAELHSGVVSGEIRDDGSLP